MAKGDRAVPGPIKPSISGKPACILLRLLPDGRRRLSFWSARILPKASPLWCPTLHYGIGMLALLGYRGQDIEEDPSGIPRKVHLNRDRSALLDSPRHC